MFYFRLVLIICKLSIKILALFGKNGGNLPGNLALTLNKKFLNYFNIKGEIIGITGTNGKTFTTNLVSSILESTGARVICNKEGNNIDTGIASLLIKNCDLSGNVLSDYLVLEVDEHYVPIVFKEIGVDSLVVLDFFRDQLDRTCEVESLIKKITLFLKNYSGNLILNADDPNVLRLAYANKDNPNVHFFSVDRCSWSHDCMNDKGEGRFCPNCSTRLEYLYYQYSHIGNFYCPNCGFGNVDCSSITDVDLSSGNFSYRNKVFNTRYSTIYNMYNFAASFELCFLYGVNLDVLFIATKSFELNNGRLETVVVNNKVSVLNLVKNPTGANVTIGFMNQDNDSKELLFVLNDNLADGRDVSWIWDINFNVLNHVDRIITSGTRAYDMAVRIKNSGYDLKKIEVYPSISDAVSSLYKVSGKKYVIFNYTAVNETRDCVLKYKDRVDGNGF